MKYYKNILEILLENANLNPDKELFEDFSKSISYREFVIKARSLGNYIHQHTKLVKHPIAVYADKSVDCLIMMFGILFSGNFYCVLDTKSPQARIDHIMKLLDPIAVISMDTAFPDNLNFQGTFIHYHEGILTDVGDIYNDLWEGLIDTDPIYALFTSGSTGVPKGTVISHKSVIAYASSVVSAFQINEESRFGNQTPFYFSMSILDIYVTIISDASLYIIPSKLFAFPKNLIQLLNKKQINTLYWVPSAMDIIVRFQAFSVIKPLYLQLVMFAGETMPVKCVTYWQKELPDVSYANLFGPTEITDTCTYHILNRIYESDESIPIGKAFDNCDVFVIDENQALIPHSALKREGELYVRGSFVGNGYYNSPDITTKFFVQNPVNKLYPEKVYRTGDRVCYNENGDLLYLGRMDSQIKHMGYRIELGEIEKACYAQDGIDTCACIYVNDKIILFVVSKHSEKEVAQWLNKKLPKYMLPYQIISKEKLNVNANGKIDKLRLEKEYYDGRKN